MQEGNESETGDIMNVDEAAVFCRCAASTVYRDSKRGIMPCIRKGRRVLFYRADLLDWLRTMRSGIVPRSEA